MEDLDKERIRIRIKIKKMRKEKAGFEDHAEGPYEVGYEVEDLDKDRIRKKKEKGESGIKINEKADAETLREGYAFAHSAWEDSNTYIDEAPPDGRSMATVCQINILMSLLLFGHKLSPDLSELSVRR